MGLINVTIIHATSACIDGTYMIPLGEKLSALSDCLKCNDLYKYRWSSCSMMISNKRMSDRLNEDIVLRESRKTVIIQLSIIISSLIRMAVILSLYFFVYVYLL